MGAVAWDGPAIANLTLTCSSAQTRVYPGGLSLNGPRRGACQPELRATLGDAPTPARGSASLPLVLPVPCLCVWRPPRWKRAPSLSRLHVLPCRHLWASVCSKTVVWQRGGSAVVIAVTVVVAVLVAVVVAIRPDRRRCPAGVNGEVYVLQV